MTVTLRLDLFVRRPVARSVCPCDTVLFVTVQWREKATGGVLADASAGTRVTSSERTAPMVKVERQLACKRAPGRADG